MPKSDFQSQFSTSKTIRILLKIFFVEDNLFRGTFFVLLILCSIKIKWLLCLKFLKNLAFFGSYFWPFSKFEDKNQVIFVISALMCSIWNVFIEFCWHDEKLTLRYSKHGNNPFLLKSYDFMNPASFNCSHLSFFCKNIFWTLEIRLILLLITLFNYKTPSLYIDSLHCTW